MPYPLEGLLLNSLLLSGDVRDLGEQQVCQCLVRLGSFFCLLQQLFPNLQKAPGGFIIKISSKKHGGGRGGGNNINDSGEIGR